MRIHEALTGIPDPEVVPMAKRCKFTAEYEQRILDEVDSCTESSQVGAILRRKGLYSSHLTAWRQQRGREILEALGPQKRRRKSKDELHKALNKPRREKERLEQRLEQAKAIIEVQKLSALLGLATEENGTGRRE